MIIYFTDRDLKILAHASTSLPAGYRIKEDTTTEEVETGLNTFSVVVSYDTDSRMVLENAVQVGRYILKQSDTTDSSNVYDSLYQIVEVETDTKTQEIRAYAEDAGLDLLNTLCPAVKLTGNIQTMLRYFLPSDWSINLEDVPTNSRTYTWDGESTATERLMSVANLFSCEIYYSFDIDRLQVTRKILNVTKKRGNQTAIPQLRLNFDVDRIYCKQSIADLVTAINVTGGTPENQELPINLKNYTYSYTDPTTGDVYKVDKATGQMRNITAMQRWSSVIDRDGLWVGSFSFDTTDKAVLAGQARAELQRRSQVAVNYEVDFAVLPEDIKIGDRVNIIDEHGELYLEARLLHIETSVSQEKRTAVIGEYLIRQSGISERVQQMASDLAEAREADRAMLEQLQVVTDTVDSLFTLEVDSNIVLGIAHLNARLLNGNKDVKTDYDPNWFKWILRNENGEFLLGRGYSLDVNMGIIGYASTVLCRFIRPELYDLTDHNLVAITDQNSDPIQVSFAGIYNQPVATRNSLKTKSKALLRATTEVGNPTVTREVNLYEKDSIGSMPQHFWFDETGENAGAHITEITKEEFKADPENGGGNLLATSRGIAIRSGVENLASFASDSAVVGKENGTHVQITPRKMSLADGNGNAYLFAGVDNDENGYASATWTIPAGTDTRYTAEWHIVRITSAVYSDGTSASISVDSDGYGVTITNRKNLSIAVAYITDSPTPYYTLGTRSSVRFGYFSSVIGDKQSAMAQGSGCLGGELNTVEIGARNAVIAGGRNNTVEEYSRKAFIAGGEDNIAGGVNSFVQGQGSIARGFNQAVFGNYNIEQGTQGAWLPTDNVLIIGNGNSASRSNAMAVTWGGEVTIAGTLSQSSDKRLKIHLRYLDDDADEFIRALKPAYYIKDGQNHVGFYAQDVEEADTWDCMTGEMNGFKTLGYTELIAPLVAYCQHLEERITELEKGK